VANLLLEVVVEPMVPADWRRASPKFSTRPRWFRTQSRWRQPADPGPADLPIARSVFEPFLPMGRSAIRRPSAL